MFIVMLIVLCVKLVAGEINSNDINKQKKFNFYWNIPTFQCDSHKLNFSALALKYSIDQNRNDRFYGDVINILYDPGSFPAILKNGSKTFLRNGGIPQDGNLTYHLNLFEKIVTKLIPDSQFAGLGVIDFESWRPIFRQNFGVLAPYKALSIERVRKQHPFWFNKWVENEAKKEFQFYGQQFMEETISLAKKLRPNATWGYYAYPYCFNMSPNNMHSGCPKDVLNENEQLEWLFQQTDNFHPSLYMENYRLSAAEKVLMIEGRLNEAHRLVGYLNKKHFNPKIIPYFWYKYLDTKKFLSKEDLFNSLTVLSSSNIDGIILWGSSSDVNTKRKCLELYQYIDDILGPLLVNT